SLPHRFICLTDERAGLHSDIETFPIPDLGLEPSRLHHGGWQKLATLGETLYDIEGMTLFLDIDVMVVGSLDVFFRSDHKMTIIRDWVSLYQRLFVSRACVGNSSVYAYRIGEHAHVVARFLADKEAAFRQFRNEQRFLTHHVGRLGYWRNGLCCSFKRDCVRDFPLCYVTYPRLPVGARIIVFHGKPDPMEAMHAGFWGWGLHRYRRAAPWVIDYWRRYG
ncbi:MAG: glycosyltransferase, partial [Alphaproteobacteria bacterium GM7ARS4]|nr:glycosyltransferase [Alphaproteobacteria bacterium GM7ARS4]